MEMTMDQRIVRVIIGVEYVLGALILLWSLYLISGPLHPVPGDAHGGMLGLFSGLILLPFSGAIFWAASAMKRGGRKHWVQQFGVIVLCAGLFAVFAAASM
jgi:hypothetical protein